MQQSDDSVSLAVILVLYNSYADTEAFLNAQGSTKELLRFIVVDNTPHARVDQLALDRFSVRSDVTVLLAYPENLGYAGAANFALQRLPELAEYDYVALSNTDLAFDASAFQKVLTETKREHTHVGAIAPRLTMRDEGEKPQLHYVEKPTRAHYAHLVRIFSNYPLTILHRLAADTKRRLGCSRNRKETPRFIFAPHGALMIFTRAYIAQTAGFAHPAFLFCEEVFVGLECEKAGLACIFEPRLTYSHKNHGAMGLIPSREIVGHLREAHKAVLPLLD
ncbi:MAG: glycosyltransferase [Fuscovulum sp.]|nr:MAG: glycosyltransferase [Fuscovulum sp.]